LKKKVLYIWKGPYPWDVRTAKFCESLNNNDYDVHLLARWKDDKYEKEKINNIIVHRVGYKKNHKLSIPIPYNPIWKTAIQKKIKEILPDLIIVREIMLAEVSGKLAKKNNIPIIMDMAENYPAAMIKSGKISLIFF
jgi:hypothetical protein